MMCALKDHTIGINYDIDAECLLCRYMFLSPLRCQRDKRSCPEKDIKKSLVAKFGKLWRFEWYKLMATKEMVKKIRMARPDKGCLKIELGLYKVYTLEDFYKPIEQCNFLEFQQYGQY